MQQGWIQVTDNGATEPLAPKTTADMVYMEGTQGETVLDAIHRRAPLYIQAELPAEGWSPSAPHTQTAAAAGLLATDIPLGDVALSDDPLTAAQQLRDYGLVGRMDAEDGQITATCYEAAPEAALTVRLLVVR